MDQARRLLNTVFGYDDFRRDQAAVIQALLEGRDALMLAPTGGGKSLCYQIPAMVRSGVGVVVSPLIALMKDQVDAMQQLGIRAAFLNSTVGYGIQQETERSLLEGALDLVYVAPERLLTERMLALLDRTELALFAIDEAHCVSQWGHDFRPEYQRLHVLHQRYGAVPRIALTATAEPRTREEIIAHLDLGKADIFIDSFDRPNIRYTLAEGQSPREQLWRFLQDEHPHDAGIVYCLSRNGAEQVAQWLRDRGREALAYHAGLPEDLRRLHQERFLREEAVVIVATIAFGMGIDKPDVRFVAHLNLPRSIEAYYQETGRAGRDGEPADAWMAYGMRDVITLRQMLQDSDAHELYKRVSQQKLEAMLGLCELTTCRRQALLAYFGETLPEACGNCDNCLAPPQTWDATVAAQKALSCIYRTGQRFGAGYIVGVLTGSEEARIRRNGHDGISTFGIGRELSGTEWRSVLRQLIARGYLDVDAEGYGMLRLTPQCKPLLRGDVRIDLRRQRKREKPMRQATAQEALRAVDEPLFEALRQLRRSIAEEQGVPPYVIFHDRTLRELARARPASLEDMRLVSGIGETKLQRYGPRFLEQIGRHPLPPAYRNNLSDTVNETLYLQQQGMDAEAIARHRDMGLSTIYGHLAEAVEAGVVQAVQVLSLTESQYAEILSAMIRLETIKAGRLKPAYEALEQEYDYGILRCVLAALRSGDSAGNA